MEADKIEEMNQRLADLEKQSFQDLLSLVEILSNATFFGKMKKNCEFAKEGQCSFFFVKEEDKNRLPIIAGCRIRDCKDTPGHFHIELSNLTCALCPFWRSVQLSEIPTRTSPR